MESFAKITSKSSKLFSLKAPSKLFGKVVKMPLYNNKTYVLMVSVSSLLFDIAKQREFEFEIYC